MPAGREQTLKTLPSLGVIPENVLVDSSFPVAEAKKPRSTYSGVAADESELVQAGCGLCRPIQPVLQRDVVDVDAAVANVGQPAAQEC